MRFRKGGAGGGEPTRLGPRLAAGDVVAGVSMAFILIPQALAYARVAGLPAHVGLYAAALPPLAAAFLASSPYLQTGPAAITSLLTAGALATLAPAGSRDYVLLASLLAVLVGAIRVAIGLFRGGKLVYLMSEPVLRGFTAGAAVIIIATQLPGALGIRAAGSGARAALAAMLDPGAWDLRAVALSATTLVLVRGARRLHPLVPGVLLAAVGGILYSVASGYDGATLGAVPEGLPPLSLRLPWGAAPSLLLAAAVIALVGFSEAASIARMFAARERQHWDPDREFLSQGAANIAAGISGGFPVGGSFSRSGLAHTLGARTRWSGAITGVTVLLFLPWAAVLAPLPVAVLAAMVIAAVAGLVRIRPILSLWWLSRPQFLVAAATFSLTILLAPRIEQAVVLGILIAVVVHLWTQFHIEVESWTEDDALFLRPRGVLWFASAEALKAEIRELIAAHPGTRRLEIRMGRLGRVDLTGALALQDVLRDAEAAGVEAELVNIHPRLARSLRAVLGDRLERVPAARGGADRFRTRRFKLPDENGAPPPEGGGAPAGRGDAESAQGRPPGGAPAPGRDPRA